MDFRTVDGLTPLIWACWIGREGCVTLLLNHGANVDIQNKNGRNRCINSWVNFVKVPIKWINGSMTQY